MKDAAKCSTGVVQMYRRGTQQSKAWCTHDRQDDKRARSYRMAYDWEWHGVVLLTRSFFILSSLAVISAHVLAQHVQSLLVYGKTRNKSNPQADNTIIDTVAQFTVPRRWFWHFYLLSSILASLNLLCVTVFRSSRDNSLPLMNCILMFIHSLRRLYETTIIERPSGSVMWIGHYFVGFGFYIFANLAMLVRVMERPSEGSSFAWPSLLVGANLIAQITQNLIHSQLARIRSSCKPGEYRNPTDGYFRYVITPHYSSEIAIYLTLALLNPFDLTIWLLLFFVATILGSSAIQTDRWGRKSFADWGSRWLILPCVL